MKRLLALLLCLCLVLPCAYAMAATWSCPTRKQENSGNFCGNCGTARPTCSSLELPICGSDVYATTIDKLSLRTGPSTKYTEPGTFDLGWGTNVNFISKGFGNGVWWVQVEIRTHAGSFRGYTGIKRFAFNDRLLANVPTDPDPVRAYLTQDEIVQRGPGSWYLPLSPSYVEQTGNKVRLYEGDWVDCYWYENGYVEVEFSLNNKLTRGWVPYSSLSR